MIQNIKDLEDQLDKIPTPTYFHKVGDKVSVGNLKDEIITQIFFNGKGYEVDYTSVDNNYGNPIISKNQKRIVSWLDVRKISTNKNSLIQNKDIFISFSNRHLEDILRKKYYFGVDMDPEYQRDYVWKQKDKDALIDSIFNNIDIGKFIFNHLPYKEDSPTYAIIDGKQRITALCDFYEDRFKYKGYYFSDLSYRDQYHFSEYNTSMAEVNNATLKEVMQLFIMINSNGKVMDKKHLDNVKYMYEKLKEEK